MAGQGPPRQVAVVENVAALPGERVLVLGETESEESVGLTVSEVVAFALSPTVPFTNARTV